MPGDARARARELTPGRRGSRFGLLPWLLACVPPLVLAALTSKLAVDVPYADQWELVELVVHAHDGRLGWNDLWTPVNEHRQVIPRLVYVALARLTSWNVLYEIALIQVLALAVFGLLALAASRSRGAFAPALAPWLVPLVSVLVFSLNQWENWLFGIQIMPVLALLASVASLCLLARDDPGWPGFGAATGLAVAASFSFGAGLMCWPVGGAVLAVGAGHARRGRMLAAWLGVGAAVASAYGLGYHRPAEMPSLAVAAHSPGQVLLYFLAFLGTPLVPPSPHPMAAVLCGTLGVACLAALSVARLRRPAAAWRPLVVWWALAGFAAGNALLAAWARSGLGYTQATAPRYVVIANLVWIALAAAAATWANDASPSLRPRLAAAGLAALALASIASSWASLPAWKTLHAQLARGRAELLRPRDAVVLRYLYPDPDGLVFRAGLLRERGLSVFREAADRSITPPGPTRVGVYRPAQALFVLGDRPADTFPYGLPGDVPLMGDWDGDGVDTVGVCRRGRFLLRNTNDVGAADIDFSFGPADGQPVAGDWDGDGVDGVGVFRAGVFVLRNSLSAGAPEREARLGAAGDRPVAGDWDGDGTDDVGVFRGDGTFVLAEPRWPGGRRVMPASGTGGWPMAGDWDGDGLDTTGARRGNKVFLRRTNDDVVPGWAFGFGLDDDRPLCGSWGR